MAKIGARFSARESRNPPVGHASRHASFAGNRRLVREPSSASICLIRSLSLSNCRFVAALVRERPPCARVHAESSRPQVISQVFEVGLKLSRSPQKKAFCRSALAVRSNAAPLLSLSLSLLLVSVSHLPGSDVLGEPTVHHGPIRMCTRTTSKRATKGGTRKKREPGGGRGWCTRREMGPLEDKQRFDTNKGMVS